MENVRRSSHCKASETSTPTPTERKICLNSPNKLSEELIRLMVTIFHKLNKTPELELSGTSSSKVNISCIGPRSLVPRVAAVSGAAALSPLRNRRASAAKGGGGHGGGDKEAAAGCHRRFVEFTRASVDVGRISLCLVDIKNLR